MAAKPVETLVFRVCPVSECYFSFSALLCSCALVDGCQLSVVLGPVTASLGLRDSLMAERAAGFNLRTLLAALAANPGTFVWIPFPSNSLGKFVLFTEE